MDNNTLNTSSSLQNIVICFPTWIQFDLREKFCCVTNSDGFFTQPLIIDIELSHHPLEFHANLSIIFSMHMATHVIK